MKPYDSQYANNKPDYVINGLKFIGTCGACPEQYDVIYDGLDGVTYIVGYVRLRYGMLYCAFPDVGGEKVYEYHFKEYSGWLGQFPTEKIRVEHLNKIAEAIINKLEGLSHGYS